MLSLIVLFSVKEIFGNNILFEGTSTSKKVIFYFYQNMTLIFSCCCRKWIHVQNFFLYRYLIRQYTAQSIFYRIIILEYVCIYFFFQFCRCNIVRFLLVSWISYLLIFFLKRMNKFLATKYLYRILTMPCDIVSRKFFNLVMMSTFNWK